MTTPGPSDPGTASGSGSGTPARRAPSESPPLAAADYGFAGSWPSIPLPTSPEDVAARVMAAAAAAAASAPQAPDNFSIVSGSTLDRDRDRDAGRIGDVSRGVAGVDGRPREDTAMYLRGVDDNDGGGGSIFSSHEGYYLASAAAARMATAASSSNTAEQDGNANFQRQERADSHMSFSSTGTGNPTMAVEGGGYYGESSEMGLNAAGAPGVTSAGGLGFGEMGRPSRERSVSTPREQVSLPEDIYGAARVSEYWHGMHALSSLASSYKYDDIWAGDGGSNPREDLIGLSTWATGGGVAAANQERGGGGEAATETGGRASNPGAGGRVSTAMLPRTWSRGSDLAQEGAAGVSEGSTAPGQETATALKWNRYSSRDRDDDSGDCRSGDGGGRDGGSRESSCATAVAGGSGQEGEQKVDDHERAWHHHRRVGCGDGGDVDGGGSRGQGKGAVPTERRSVRRRRTPSLHDDASSGNCSASGDEGAVFPSIGVRKGAEAGGRRMGAEAPRGRQNEPHHDQESTGERHCKRVASPNAGSLLSTTSSTTAMGAPAVGSGSTTLAGASGSSTEGVEGTASTAGRAPDAQRRFASAPGGSLKTSADIGKRWRNTPSLDGGDRDDDPDKFSWTKPSSIAPMTPGAPSPSTAVFSSGDEETFFAEHALEPKPRAGWDREGCMAGEGADPTEGRVVAQGITVHRLAQGIGVPRWGQHTQIHGTALSHSDRLPVSGQSSSAAGGAARPHHYHRTPSPTTGATLGWRDPDSPSPVFAKIGSSTLVGDEGTRDRRRSAFDGQSGAAPRRGSAAAGGNCSANEESSVEWQVQPESMAAYFTSVTGLVPPVGPAPQVPPNRLPIPNYPAAGLGVSGPGRDERRDDSSSGEGKGGGAETGAPGLSNESLSQNGAGAEWATSAGAAAASTSQSCSMSYADPVDGSGGGGGSSWGW